jgi:hypothetical protein
MWLLPTPVRRDAVAIDVGAANGVYAYFLQRLARTCHAFEANPNSTALLKAPARRDGARLRAVRRLRRG